jgi:hypothetical protein
MAEEVEAPLRRMNGKGKWAELSVVRTHSADWLMVRNLD